MRIVRVTDWVKKIDSLRASYEPGRFIVSNSLTEGYAGRVEPLILKSADDYYCMCRCDGFILLLWGPVDLSLTSLQVLDDVPVYGTELTRSQVSGMEREVSNHTKPKFSRKY